MRKDIQFKTEDGVTLRGWHYLPDGRRGKVPTIVMAHGFSAVKEMYLDRFAEAFAVAGLGSVVFDNRNFGASDGEPRQEIDPWCQVRDYRDAITFAETVEETDADRIGIWGSSYSGGHVLVVGAIDRRVKCVVAQVPLASGHDNARRLIRADYLAGVRKLFEDDRRVRMAGGAPGIIPVVAEDPAAPSALPTPDSWTWFTETGKSRAPSWKNEVTLRSVEMFTEYEPGSYASFISPTPLLMVVALGDVLTVADLALAAYETALEPKRLVTLSGGHFDAYVKDFEFRFQAGSRVVQSAPRIEVAIPTFMVASQGRGRFSASSPMSQEHTRDNIIIDRHRGCRRNPGGSRTPSPVICTRNRDITAKSEPQWHRLAAPIGTQRSQKATVSFLRPG